VAVYGVLFMDWQTTTGRGNETPFSGVCFSSSDRLLGAMADEAVDTGMDA